MHNLLISPRTADAIQINYFSRFTSKENKEEKQLSLRLRMRETTVCRSCRFVCFVFSYRELGRRRIVSVRILMWENWRICEKNISENCKKIRKFHKTQSKWCQSDSENGSGSQKEKGSASVCVLVVFCNKILFFLFRENSFSPTHFQWSVF